MAHTRRQARPESVDEAFDGLGPRRDEFMNRAFEPTSWHTAIRRRTFLRGSAYGLGGIALAGLLDPSLFSAAAREADTRKPADHWRGVINPPHLPIKARRVIHLCMAGG